MLAQELEDLIPEEPEGATARKLVGGKPTLAGVSTNHLHIHTQQVGNLGRIQDRGQVATVHQSRPPWIDPSIIWVRVQGWKRFDNAGESYAPTMTSEQPITPDAIEPPASGEVAPPGEPPPGAGLPTKLIRIASMTRAMLEEVRHAPLDEQGKARLADVHSRSLNELREMLPADLLDEFNEIMVPLHHEKPSEPELRIAQAQLIGWLEGLFHGIQASLFSQQMAAQQQLQEMARRTALSRGTPEGDQPSSGLYL